MCIKPVMPSNHLILCHPLLLLPSVFPSIRVFSNELALHIRWPKYWSFSFSISPSNEYSGLISFRIDWFDLLGVQGTLKGLLKWVSSSHQVAKVLEFQLQHQSFQWIFRTDFLQDWLVWSPCSPRDSQESSLTPQFKSIKCPTLTSIHDYWKNHSFD